jgi:type II secretory pathway pseudopilin PulG
MKPPHDEGFTLVETLVAFVILSGAIILGYQIFGQGLSRLASVEQSEEITAVARQILVEQQLGSAEVSGQINGVQWSATTSLLSLKDDRSNEFQVSPYVLRVYAGKPLRQNSPPILETIILRASAAP